jgi:hypothetical protein
MHPRQAVRQVTAAQSVQPDWWLPEPLTVAEELALVLAGVGPISARPSAVETSVLVGGGAIVSLGIDAGSCGSGSSGGVSTVGSTGTGGVGSASVAFGGSGGASTVG